jgi:hypothetical protein
MTLDKAKMQKLGAVMLDDIARRAADIKALGRTELEARSRLTRTAGPNDSEAPARLDGPV